MNFRNTTSLRLVLENYVKNQKTVVADTEKAMKAQIQKEQQMHWREFLSALVKYGENSVYKKE